MPAAADERCFGEGDPLYEHYHDTEWGFPVTDEQGLYERLCLEAFQAGLSWRTVLHKREAFRAAFAGFEPERVARFTGRDVARLMRDAGIIRNRAKIEAAIGNARILLQLHESGQALVPLAWEYAPLKARAPRTRAEVPAVTPESEALSRRLRGLGFRFLGPTTAYAMMQATGMVNDHLSRCAVRTAVERKRVGAFRRLGLAYAA